MGNRDRRKKGPKARRSGARTNYELPVSLSEKQIEADVSNYFGFLSSSFREFGKYRLLDIDEQITGADKKFNWQGTAYYLQFKKPCALKPCTESELASRLRSNADKKQRIRRFRSTEGLEDFPYSVCFSLHGQAKTASDLQHNILRSYEKPPNSRATYVCPLVTDPEEYSRLLGAFPHPEFPFDYLPFQWIRDGLHVAHVARHVPLLRGHAAIVPHVEVDSADHYYSFSRNATDIAFHSPKLVAEGPLRLSDFVAAEALRHQTHEGLPLTRLVEHLREASHELTELFDGTETAPREPLDWLQWHGRLLRRYGGIRQFVLLKRNG